VTNLNNLHLNNEPTQTASLRLKKPRKHLLSKLQSPVPALLSRLNAESSQLPTHVALQFAFEGDHGSWLSKNDFSQRNPQAFDQEELGVQCILAAR
jgi:hypothetical protein